MPTLPLVFYSYTIPLYLAYPVLFLVLKRFGQMMSCFSPIAILYFSAILVVPIISMFTSFNPTALIVWLISPLFVTLVFKAFHAKILILVFTVCLILYHKIISWWLEGGISPFTSNLVLIILKLPFIFLKSMTK